MASKIVKKVSPFVPMYKLPSELDFYNFKMFLKSYNNILVLSGAGVSTESGIPDYRSQDVGRFSNPNYKPIQHSSFVHNHDTRTRFWARNYIGWPIFSSAQPNKVHHFISEFGCFTNKIIGVVTQNIDGLHHKAGNRNIIELHGNAFWVRCLQCNDLICRHDFQSTLRALNPGFEVSPKEIRPDGDVDLSDEMYNKFVIPECQKCGGILKPTVVFFGDNVPPGRVKTVQKMVDQSDALLVMGTSLSTLSSLRIVKEAFDSNKFICILNIGKTEGDKYSDLIIQTNCSEIVPDLVQFIK